MCVCPYAEVNACSDREQHIFQPRAVMPLQCGREESDATVGDIEMPPHCGRDGG